MADRNPLLDLWETPLRRAPTPTEGDNYGYASSPPYQMTDGTAWSLLMPLYGAYGLGLANIMRGVGNFVGGNTARGATQFAGGAGTLKGAYGVNESLPFRAAEHHVMGGSDPDLDAMRYYGHDNLRGPR